MPQLVIQDPDMQRAFRFKALEIERFAEESARRTSGFGPAPSEPTMYQAGDGLLEPLDAEAIRQMAQMTPTECAAYIDSVRKNYQRFPGQGPASTPYESAKYQMDRAVSLATREGIGFDDARKRVMG